MLFKLLLILYAIGWLYNIKESILWLIPYIKCRHIHNCKKDNCPIRHSCRRTALSDAEKADLRKKIASLDQKSP